MDVWLALTRREAGALFGSPAALFTAAFFALLYGIAFQVSLAVSPVAAFDEMALFVAYLSLLLAPLATMRSFASETSDGSLELLLTAPVRPAAVVLSKFFGAFLYYLATLIPCVVFAVLLAGAGRLDWGATCGAFLGLVLAGALFVAVGLWASSLTTSVVAAAAAACGGLFLLLILEEFDPAAGSGRAAAHALGFLARLRRFVSGEIAARDILYFAFFAGWLLYMTWLALEGRGGIGRQRKPRDRRQALAAGILWMAAALALIAGVAWLHIDGRLVPSAWPAAWARYGWRFLGWPAVPAAGALVLAAAGCLCQWRAGRVVRPTGPRAAGTGAPPAPPTLPEPVSPEPVSAASTVKPPAPRRRATCWGVAAMSLSLVLAYAVSGLPWRLAAERAGAGALVWLEAPVWDWSDDGRNTLPPELVSALGQVTAPLTVNVFYSADSVDAVYHGVPLPLLTRQMLERCAAANPLVRARFVDAYRDPDAAAEAAKTFGIDLAKIDQAAVLEYEGRRHPMAAIEVLKPPPPEARMAAGDDAGWGFAGEAAFASALLRIIDPRVTRVGFTQGRGELGLGSASSGRTASQFYAALRDIGFAVRPVSLDPGDEPPRDCDVLVLAGPQRLFEPEVVARLDEWTKNGGRLLYFIPPASPRWAAGADPDAADENPADLGPALAKLLRAWGGAPRADHVRDARFCYDGQETAPLATTRSATASEGRQIAAALPGARSLRDFPSDDGWNVEPFLATSPSSLGVPWSERGRIREGPFTVAYRSVRPRGAGQPEGRVAVVSSSESVSNAGLDKASNRELWLGLVVWLSGRSDLAPVVERPWVDRQLKLSARQSRAFGWVAMGLLPLAWCGAGALAWWSRRQ